VVDSKELCSGAESASDKDNTHENSGLAVRPCVMPSMPMPPSVTPAAPPEEATESHSPNFPSTCRFEVSTRASARFPEWASACGFNSSRVRCPRRVWQVSSLVR
jgi:hypothetical protein